MSKDKPCDEAAIRSDLQKEYGDVYDTAELQKAFVVEGFGAGLVCVKRLSDGVRGTMNFDHMPRFYYDFQPA